MDSLARRGPDESGIFLPLTGTMIYPKGDRVLRYLREGWFEFREMALMSLIFRPGDCVIDVGAHCGLYSRIAAERMQGNGTIVAVEPNPAMHRFIKQNIAATEVGPNLPIAHKKVSLVTAAVAAGNGDGLLHLGPADSSAYATLAGIARTEGMIRVATRSLQSLIPDGVAGPIFIKLDVEGFEYAIVEAASDFLRSRSDIHLMVEFDEGNVASAGRTTAELASLLERLGYQLHYVDDAEIQLRRHTSQQPLWGANLIATRNPDALTHRIETAPRDVLEETVDFFERGRAAEKIYRESEDHGTLLKSIGDLAPAFARTVRTLTGSVELAASTMNRFHGAMTGNSASSAESAKHLLNDEIGRIEGMARSAIDRIDELGRSLAERVYELERIRGSLWFRIARKLFRWSRPVVGLRAKS